MPYLGATKELWKWLKDNFGLHTFHWDCKNINDIVRWTYIVGSLGELTFYFKNKEDAMLFKLVWSSEK